MGIKIKSKDYPDDKTVELLLPCGKVERKLESSILRIIHGWLPHEIRVVQRGRKK